MGTLTKPAQMPRLPSLRVRMVLMVSQRFRFLMSTLMPMPLELKIVLREFPENGHPPDGEPLTPTPELIPMPKPPVKKTKSMRLSLRFFDQLETGEQTTAALATSSGRSERSVRRVLAEMMSDGKVSRVKKGVYRLSRSVKWREADNETLINAGACGLHCAH